MRYQSLASSTWEKVPAQVRWSAYFPRIAASVCYYSTPGLFAMRSRATIPQRPMTERVHSLLLVPVLIWALTGGQICLCSHSHESESGAAAVAEASHHDAGDHGHADAHSHADGVHSQGDHAHNVDGHSHGPLSGEHHDGGHHAKNGADDCGPSDCGGGDCGPDHECECVGVEVAASKPGASTSAGVDSSVAALPVAATPAVWVAPREFVRVSRSPSVRANGPPAFLLFCTFRC